MPKKSTFKDKQVERRFFLRRTIVIAAWMTCMLALLVLRLIYLQVIAHPHYTTLSKQNQLAIIPIEANRGLIYDRHGMLLAENIPVFSLEITPERIKNLDQTISQLQSIIKLDEDELKAFKHLTRQRRPFEPVPLKVQLTEEEVARFSVNQYHYPGVNVAAHLIRHYPFGPAFVHVLGYVARINEKEFRHIDQSNYSASNFIGKLGIEKYYEAQLHGKMGYKQVETNASGRSVRVMKRVRPTPGENLYLSIDGELQMAAEKAIGEEKGTVVAIEPSTGEVLALVSMPIYDPNPFVKGISHKAYQKLLHAPQRPLYNRAVRGVYPLGSTVKPFIAVGALEEEVVTNDFRIRDPGWFKIPGTSHVFRDWRLSGHGTVNLKRAIIVSCDTYFYTLANMLGINRLAGILTRFGFGLKTQIDMDEELAGLVGTPDWKRRSKGQPWYGGDTISAGIGQGYMLTTPLQLASATATVAMSGQRYRPRLLKKIETPGQEMIDIEPIKEFPIMLQHDDAWELVRDAMRNVIASGEGTAGGRFGRDAPYVAAGKTGTSQVYSSNRYKNISKEDRPKHLRNHALFIAFAPYDEPKIAVAVIMENTKKAVQISRKVIDFYLTGKPHESDPKKNTA